MLMHVLLVLVFQCAAARVGSSPTMYDHLPVCMIPVDVIGWSLLSTSQYSAKLILHNNLYSIPAAIYKISHRDIQQSGNKNGAIPPEVACSHPAKI